MTLLRFVNIVFILLALGMVRPAYAADKVVKKLPEVEVDLGVLDAKGVPDPDSYMPLITPSKKKDVYIAPTVFTVPANVPEPLTPMPRDFQRLSAEEASTFAPPPVPPRKPERTQITEEEIATPAPEAQEITETVEAKPVKPPKPPRHRSDVVMSVGASPEYTRQVEAGLKDKHSGDNSIPVPVSAVQEEKLSGGEKDHLESQLVEPSAADVLKSLKDADKGRGDDEDDETGVVEEAQTTSLLYPRAGVNLDDDMKKQILRNNILAQASEPEARVEIEAHASPSTEGPSAARRLSLARALEVRDFLLSQSLDPKKIDIKALGDQTGGKTAEIGEEIDPDRVDIYVVDTSNH